MPFCLHVLCLVIVVKNDSTQLKSFACDFPEVKASRLWCRLFYVCAKWLCVFGSSYAIGAGFLGLAQWVNIVKSSVVLAKGDDVKNRSHGFTNAIFVWHRDS